MSPQLAAIFLLSGAALWIYRKREAARKTEAAREAARSGGKRGTKGSKPNPAPAPSGVFALWGLSRTELTLGGTAVVLAAFLGLLLGGYFA